MTKAIPVIIIFFVFACTTRPVEPTSKSRHTIDTLYQQKVITLQPEMDLKCDSVFKSIYSEAVDSITKVREQEMNILVE